MTNILGEEKALWHKLSKREKVSVVYFIVSFALLMTAGEGIMWMTAVVLNFRRAAEKVKGVSLEGLEEN